MELIELMLVLATIVGVADGNTVRVKVDSGETGAVKLACINIPETVKQQYRIAATQKLKKLLPSGTPVVIRVVQSGESDRDRAVGEVFLDNRSVNNNGEGWRKRGQMNIRAETYAKAENLTA